MCNVAGWDGIDRLPTWADEASLPYVSYITKEVLRFTPVIRLGKLFAVLSFLELTVALSGLPHCVLCEDQYLDYRIPHGSTIIANIWQDLLSHLLFMPANVP
jgi:hypothetical protein